MPFAAVASIPHLLEVLSHFEEVGGEARLAEIDAESLDDAAAVDECASRLPEGTVVERAGRRVPSRRDAKCADASFPRRSQRTVSLNVLSSAAWPTIVIM